MFPKSRKSRWDVTAMLLAELDISEMFMMGTRFAETVSRLNGNHGDDSRTTALVQPPRSRSKPMRDQILSVQNKRAPDYSGALSHTSTMTGN